MDLEELCLWSFSRKLWLLMVVSAHTFFSLPDHYFRSYRCIYKMQTNGDLTMVISETKPLNILRHKCGSVGLKECAGQLHLDSWMLTFSNNPHCPSLLSPLPPKKKIH